MVASSVGWTLVRMLSEQIALFVIFAVLTRLLPASAFGAIAIAILCVEVGKLIASNGISEGVIQAADLDEELADTAFWSNLSLSLLVAVVMLAIAWPLGALMHSPELPMIVAALAIVPVITAAGAIHTARIVRGFGYKAMAYRSMVANLIGGAASIAIAYAGGGVWALVLQRVISESILTVASWVAFPWRPRWRLSVARGRGLLGYGFHVAVTGLLFLVSSRIHELIVGATISLAAVGLLRIAFRLTELISQFAVRPFSTIASPTFARMRDDPVRLQSGYARLQGVCAAIAFPAFVGVGVLAAELVPLAFGEAWRESVPVAQVLTLLVVPIVMNFFVTPALYAVGRPNIAVQIAIVQLILGGIACWIAAPFGIVWVAIAYVARAYVTMPYVVLTLQRHAGISPRQSLASLMAPAFAAAVMAGIVWYARRLLVDLLPTFALILAAAAIGAIVYASLLWLTDRRLILETYDMVRNRGGKDPEAAAAQSQ